MKKGNTKNSKKRMSTGILRKGHIFKFGPHPPSFCSRPWFPLTVAILDIGQTLTYSQLAGALAVQTGLSAGDFFAIRIRSIRIWGPIPITATPLRVVFYDIFSDPIPTGSAPGVLEQITNFPDGVNRETVGYLYSGAQQNNSLVMGPGLTTPITAQTGAGTGSVMYVSLLFRIENTSGPTSNWWEEYGSSDSEVEVVSRSVKSLNIASQSNSRNKK